MGPPERARSGRSSALAIEIVGFSPAGVDSLPIAPAQACIMTKTIAFVAALGAGLLLVVSAAGVSHAQIDLRRIGADVTDLPFGKDADAVTRWVGERLKRSYAARIAASVDRSERGKLEAQRDRELQEFRAGLVSFDGARTGYEVSLVAGEFGVGTRESMLRWSDGAGDHFFFFVDDALWKYALSQPPATPFPNRLAELAKALGKPASVDSERVAGDTLEPVHATWQDGRSRVRLVNRRVIYGQDLLIVEDRPRSDQVAELRAKSGAPDVEKRVDDLDRFLLDPDEDEESELEAPPGKRSQAPSNDAPPQAAVGADAPLR
jgi:hypothetical protein